MEQQSEIKIINPPSLLTILPILGIAGGIWFGYKNKYSVGKIVLVSVAASLVLSSPSWIWAKMINKQFEKQTTK